VDRYCFDFDQMKFTVSGEVVELSKTEQKLLRLLVENQGATVSRSTLVDRIWTDGADFVDENALSVTVKRLRDKLGAQDSIKTVYGIGYRWEVSHG
jgi:DNA-binding response OmpR family regulator